MLTDIQLPFILQRASPMARTLSISVQQTKHFVNPYDSGTHGDSHKLCQQKMMQNRV
jgi:hypothetical protein